MATFPWGNRGVLTVDPVTGLPAAEPVNRMIAFWKLVTKTQLDEKASSQSVTDLASTVNGYAAGINQANQTASSALSAAGANLAAVPAQSKAALIALGYLPRIVYNAGWPALGDALAAMGLTGYTGAVRWDSAKSPGAPAPTGARVGDDWERKKS